MVRSKSELRQRKMSNKHNSYTIEAEFEGCWYSIVERDMLSAYKLLHWAIEDREKEDGYAIAAGFEGVIGGFIVTDSGGFAKWYRLG